MVAIERRVWTIEEYHRLIETGCLREGERVELIRGEIVHLPRMTPKWAAKSTATVSHFYRMTDGTANIRTHAPITLPPDSEPEPQIAIARGRSDYYRSAHPSPNAVLPVIEFSESALPYDREVKGPLYAEAGIPEYWLVDLIHNRVEVYRNLAGDIYRSKTIYQRGDTVTPLNLPGLSIRVEEIIG